MKISIFSKNKKSSSVYPVKTNINNLYKAFVKCSEENIGLVIDFESNNCLKDSLVSLIIPNSTGVKDSYSGLDYYYIAVSSKDGSVYFINSYTNSSYPEKNKTTALRITYPDPYELAESFGEECYNTFKDINENNWKDKLG